MTSSSTRLQTQRTLTSDRVELDKAYNRGLIAHQTGVPGYPPSYLDADEKAAWLAGWKSWAGPAFPKSQLPNYAFWVRYFV